jgi:hypothetical protein
MSVEDAAEQANKQGVAFSNLSIEPLYEAFMTTLAPEFEGLGPNITGRKFAGPLSGRAADVLFRTRKMCWFSQPVTKVSSQSVTQPCTAIWPGGSMY